MSRLRLWGHARFRAGRVLWMLEELGIDYEHRPLWSRTADMEAPDFLAASPRRKIPVIQDGDFTLTESAAINTYLCDTYAPDSGWVPPPCTRDRAIYDAWLMTIMTELDAQSLYIHRKHQCLSEVYGAAPVVVDAARDYFLRQLESVTSTARVCCRRRRASLRARTPSRRQTCCSHIASAGQERSIGCLTTLSSALTWTATPQGQPSNDTLPRQGRTLTPQAPGPAPEARV